LLFLWCETESVTVRKPHRLRGYVKVLRSIFEPNREEVAGGWRRLHNKELHNLHVSRNIIRAIKGRVMRRTGRDKKCIRNFGREIWREGT